MDRVAAIIEYEQGTLGARATLELFGALVRTGDAWTLQGHYGRTARSLLEAGIIDREGGIAAEGEDKLEERGL